MDPRITFSFCLEAPCRSQSRKGEPKQSPQAPELRIQRPEFGKDEAARVCRIAYQRRDSMQTKSSRNRYAFSLKSIAEY